MIMTTKGKVYTFYSIIIVLLITALMVFNFNVYAKAVICFFILACLLIMRSVQKSWMLPPGVNSDTLEPMTPTDSPEQNEEVDKSKSKQHNDSIDAYLTMMLRADKELSDEPTVDKDSPSYNNLLNERILAYLNANK